MSTTSPDIQEQLKIYIAAENTTEGPFSLDEIQSGILQGKISAMTLAWYTGVSGWIPLGSLLKDKVTFPPLAPSFQFPPDMPTQSAPMKTPGIGLASFWMALLGVPFWFILLMIAGVAHNAGAGTESPVMIFTGLAMFAGFGVNALGVILGGIAANQKDVKQTLSWLGTGLNLCEILGMIGLMILGLMMKG